MPPNSSHAEDKFWILASMKNISSNVEKTRSFLEQDQKLFLSFTDSCSIFPLLLSISSSLDMFVDLQVVRSVRFQFAYLQMHGLISMASAQFSVVKATSLNFINPHMFEAQPGSLCDPAFWVFVPTQLILQPCHSSIQSFLPDGHFHIKQKEGEHMDGKIESCQRAGCRERPWDFACSWGRKK